MRAAKRLINQLDKALSSFDSFGDDPTSHVEEVLTMLKTPLDRVNLRSQTKPELMEEIKVERDRALLKQEILNRVIAG
ncbi:hypothetical protein SynRS9907_01403 [Synechococcus sp. RS9907]|nr:hypothetical protein SynRS9907_01403 [Synechococcus sp. RS9907]